MTQNNTIVISFLQKKSSLIIVTYTCKKQTVHAGIAPTYCMISYMYVLQFPGRKAS